MISKKLKQEKKREAIQYSVEVVKSSGVKISRKNIFKDSLRFFKENDLVLSEAHREAKVLSMKRYFLKRNWTWPPKTHKNATTVHMINIYYGKVICKHVPQDDLEKLIVK